MRIHHIALASEWERARREGAYTTSTRGRSLAEEGFLHASRRDQVATVWERYYRDVREPLVLLTIDTDRLEVPWREDPVGDDTYPHVYGPLSPAAVVRVQPMTRGGGTEPFTVIFVRLVLGRVGLAVTAMLAAALGAAAGTWAAARWGGAWTPFLGAVVGLLAGGAAYDVLVRRRLER